MRGEKFVNRDQTRLRRQKERSKGTEEKGREGVEKITKRTKKKLK